MPRLSELRPMLYTKELEATIAFYVDILGFVCDEYIEEFHWASLSRDGVAIMLAHPNAHTPFVGPTFTGSFYFNTDDVDALWLDLKDKAQVCYEIDDFSYGMREFAIFDNNGYLLQFGKPIDE